MINNVVLVGRTTKDPELRYTPSNVAVATFSLAVNRNFKDANGERETDFINCVIWRQQAENLANWAKKGALIGITGRIQTRSYENQQGQRVYVTEVVAENFQMLRAVRRVKVATLLKAIHREHLAMIAAMQGLMGSKHHNNKGQTLRGIAAHTETQTQWISAMIRFLSDAKECHKWNLNRLKDTRASMKRAQTGQFGRVKEKQLTVIGTEELGSVYGSVEKLNHRYKNE